MQKVSVRTSVTFISIAQNHNHSVSVSFNNLLNEWHPLSWDLRVGWSFSLLYRPFLQTMLLYISLYYHFNWHLQSNQKHTVRSISFMTVLQALVTERTVRSAFLMETFWRGYSIEKGGLVLNVKPVCLLSVYITTDYVLWNIYRLGI